MFLGGVHRKEEMERQARVISGEMEADTALDELRTDLKQVCRREERIPHVLDRGVPYLLDCFFFACCYFDMPWRQTSAVSD